MIYFVRWTFSLGVTCALIALAWRGLMTIGYFLPEQIILGRTIYDMSFYKGALLFLLLSIAASNYADYRDKHRHAQRRREAVSDRD